MQERFVAGSLAGATAQTIIYPMEVRRRGLGRGPIAGWGPGITILFCGVISIGILTLPLPDSDCSS